MTDLRKDHEALGFPLSVAEASRYLGVGRKVIYQLIDYDRIRAIRRKRMILIDRDSLDEFRRSGGLT